MDATVAQLIMSRLMGLPIIYVEIHNRYEIDTENWRAKNIAEKSVPTASMRKLNIDSWSNIMK